MTTEASSLTGPLVTGQPAELASIAWSAVSRLDDRSLEAFVDAHDLQRTNVLNLANVRFGTPSGLVGLLLAAETARRYHDSVVINLKDDEFRRYLSRSRFIEFASPTCRLVPGLSEREGIRFAHRYGRSKDLIELTRLEVAEDLRGLIERTIDTLTEGLGYSRRQAFRVVTMVSEAGMNLIEHAGIHGYAALQSYSPPSGRFVELAIGDAGRGIRDRLRENVSFTATPSDIAAIKLAVRPGVSTFGPSRGIGLAGLVTATRAHGGSLQVRSGTGRVRIRAGRPQLLPFEGARFPGTQITITLPAVVAA